MSRGGGPTYRGIRALPKEAFTGDLKLTEQGETRAFYFANPDLSTRYLEQTLGAALVTRLEARRGAPTRDEESEALLERLAEESWRAYRALVEDKDLLRYFLEATLFRSVVALQIGSRPAKRTEGEMTLDDLRAIPWVFA